MTQGESTLAVVHLIRKSNGLSPFLTFLESYRRHAAGVPHDLVLVFKGFTSATETEPYTTLAMDLPFHQISVDDEGYDLGAYFAVARQLRYERFCFLNSFSVLQADGWLELLARALGEPSVGLAGASGSWASVASRVHWELWRRGAYVGVFDDQQAFPEKLLDTFATFDRPAGRPRRVHRLWTLGRLLRSYRGFPAHHVRTNGFVIERATMLRLRAPQPRDKIEAHLLECGRHSITRQIELMRMHVVVAGRDGNYCCPPDWARTRTFWQGDQENLLIADNQTENYKQGGPSVRTALSRWAWGAAAEPRAAGG
jgi:hypothetical protein